MKKKTVAKASKRVVVNFNQLADWGLLGEINRRVLHPRGLALRYFTDRGISDGAYIAEDFVWDFSPELDAEITAHLKAFDDNRIALLQSELSRKNGAKSK